MKTTRRAVRWPVGLAAALFLLVAAGDGRAATGDLKKDPVGVVKAYVSLDMKGARLEPLSWETLKPFITWKEEPAWGKVVVVESYEVVDDIKAWEVVNLYEVVIPVKFRVLGAMYWEAVSFLPEPQVEEVRFRVKAVRDRWRIVEPMAPPHVGRKRLINFVRQAMLQETDGAKLVKLTELRDELKKVGKEP
jgi:hypothetical protein